MSSQLKHGFRRLSRTQTHADIRLRTINNNIFISISYNSSSPAERKKISFPSWKQQASFCDNSFVDNNCKGCITMIKMWLLTTPRQWLHLTFCSFTQNFYLPAPLSLLVLVLLSFSTRCSQNNPKQISTILGFWTKIHFYSNNTMHAIRFGGVNKINKRPVVKTIST